MLAKKIGSIHIYCKTCGVSVVLKDLFLKIIKREIPADIVYETEEILAFRDINPQAPVHILVIPKKQIETTDDLTGSDEGIAGKLLVAATAIARSEGLSDSGYRLVMNCKSDGGQTVAHIHIHLLGGRQMHWPPG